MARVKSGTNFLRWLANCLPGIDCERGKFFQYWSCRILVATLKRQMTYFISPQEDRSPRYTRVAEVAYRLDTFMRDMASTLFLESGVCYNAPTKRTELNWTCQVEICLGWTAERDVTLLPSVSTRILLVPFHWAREVQWDRVSVVSVT